MTFSFLHFASRLPSFDLRKAGSTSHRVGRLLSGLALVASIAAVGCSSSSDGPGIVEGTCEAAAVALCDKIDTCAPFYSQILYGDRASCIAVGKAGCDRSVAANGSNLGVSLGACINSYKAATCEKVLGGNFDVPECQPKGKLPDATPCGEGVQCASGKCSKTGAYCGVCQAAVPIGGACKDGSVCVTGASCISDKCEKNAAFAKGDACTTSCGSFLTCVSGKCTDRGETGALCGKDFGECNNLRGYFCNAKNSKCELAKTVKVGEACGLDTTTGSYTLCNNSNCEILKGTTGGSCKALPKTGEPCAKSGPNCAAGLECITGTCQTVDPSTCK